MPADASIAPKKLRYDLALLDRYPTLTPELLRLAYRHVCLARCHFERVVQECQKGTIKFATWGSGEEIHEVAGAIALHEVVNAEAFGMVTHYRSGAMLGMWSHLRGYHDFFLDHMRQQFSRATDPWSGGRQMASHYNDLRINAVPIQSPVGMQIDKAVGYAHGLVRHGHRDGVVLCVVGDGTCAESDMHEGMTGASVLQAPVIFQITDNNIAISVKPKDGRGIRDFAAYAKAFGFEFFSCDGNDFLESYDVMRKAAIFVRDRQRPALFWVRNLSRLNDHSAAADFAFKFDEYDPVPDFGAALVERGILEENDIIRLGPVVDVKDYFRRHELGRVGSEADDDIVRTIEISQSEPEPTVESVFDHIREPFPQVVEAPPVGRSTCISLNGAIRAAMQGILASNPMTWIYGQDVAEKGGVMQATKGLWERFPEQIRDAPINEPFIIGSALGFALHPGATAIPEIQFSDYSLNTMHWLVYLGNLLWTSNGTARANVIVRLPVEPLHGGAVYHSMCMEGFYCSIPGLTIVAPTTSRDCYGLLRTAAEYSGPVLVFESKGLYRMALGDAFPGEPTDAKQVAALKRAIYTQGHIPELPEDFRVPLGKAAVRRTGKDITVVTWGRATLFCAEAAERLAGEGIDCEIIDLRTIVPPDLEAVLASVRKTGRLLVAHEDRVFSGMGREIQGAVTEALADDHVVTSVVGQDAVPGIPQNLHLEHHVVLRPDKVEAAVRRVLAVRRPTEVAARTSTRAQSVESQPSVMRTRVLWTPNRHFVA